MEEVCFSRFLKMAKDSAARIELGKSFHQEGTFNLKVHESDFAGSQYKATFTCRKQASSVTVHQAQNEEMWNYLTYRT